MSGVERPVGFLVHPQSFSNSDETSWDFFVHLIAPCAPAKILNSLVPVSSMFIDWLSPKPVLLLATQRQEVLKWFGCCILLG